MKELKKNVRNWARAEGCMAENYLANEYVNFSNNYDSDAVIVSEKFQRNNDTEGRGVGAAKTGYYTGPVYQKAHSVVLQNLPSVEPYIE